MEVTNAKINNEKLGEIIGRHQAIEFAPLKRLTDLIVKQLFRVSDKHNIALLIVVENIVKQLPDEPITHLKKLLEIYGELLAMTNSKIADPTIARKMETWKNSASLKRPLGVFNKNQQVFFSKRDA